MKKTIKFDILVGLPGSGKTHYASFKKREEGDSCHVIDCDWLKENHIDLDYVLNEGMLSSRIFLFEEHDHIICDGLFTTKESQKNAIESIIRSYKNFFFTPHHQLNINFIHFNENRDVCLHNDSFRNKKRQADITIKHLPLDKPDIDGFKKEYTDDFLIFSLITKDIYKMSKVDILREKHYNKYWSQKLETDVMISEAWNVGGTVCDYTGGEYKVIPEDQPTSFEELDDLLLEIAPKVSFLEYKKIMNTCVTIEEDDDYDYYGGCVHRKFYCCKLDLLFSLLKEFGYLED